MKFPNSRPIKTNKDEAAAIALQGLTFLAADEQRLSRFLALTGIGPAELKIAAATDEFQAAILDYLLRDESLLLVFAAECGIAPEKVAPAYAMLSGAGA